MAFICFAMRMWLSESVVRFVVLPSLAYASLLAGIRRGPSIGPSLGSGRNGAEMAPIFSKWSRNGAEIYVLVAEIDAEIDPEIDADAVVNWAQGAHR